MFERSTSDARAAVRAALAEAQHRGDRHTHAERLERATREAA